MAKLSRRSVDAAEHRACDKQLEQDFESAAAKLVRLAIPQQQPAAPAQEEAPESVALRIWRWRS